MMPHSVAPPTVLCLENWLSTMLFSKGALIASNLFWHGCLDSVEWNGGLKWWNRLEWWNGIISWILLIGFHLLIITTSEQRPPLN